MQNRMLALNCDCPDSFQCQDSSFGLRKNLQVKYTNSPINSTSTMPNIINPMILPILTEFVACGVGAGVIFGTTVGTGVGVIVGVGEDMGVGVGLGVVVGDGDGDGVGGGADDAERFRNVLLPAAQIAVSFA